MGSHGPACDRITHREHWRLGRLPSRPTRDNRDLRLRLCRIRRVLGDSDICGDSEHHHDCRNRVDHRRRDCGGKALKTYSVTAAAIAGSAVPAFSRSTKSASWLSGVTSGLISTTVAPLEPAMKGSSAAG